MDCYYEQLVEEVIEDQELFCSLYMDRGSHFFYTAKVGGAVNKSRLTDIRRVLRQLGIKHIPSYCPQGRVCMERFSGSWQGSLPQELGELGIRLFADAKHYVWERFLL